MQIAIELPNDFVALSAEPEIKKEIRNSYALWLYQRGRITLVKAAEMAGVDLYDFMAICKDNQVPIIDISRDELVEEMKALSPA